LEQRLQLVLDELEAEAPVSKLAADRLGEHLSLLARWYYRPPARRTGEIFFRDEAHGARKIQPGFPLSRVLRGISRVFCGQKEVPDAGEASGSAAAGHPI
jgi:excinuclease ABC subunit C